jgi:hypothetical protein
VLRFLVAAAGMPKFVRRVDCGRGHAKMQDRLDLNCYSFSAFLSALFIYFDMGPIVLYKLDYALKGHHVASTANFPSLSFLTPPT